MATLGSIIWIGGLGVLGREVGKPVADLAPSPGVRRLRRRGDPGGGRRLPDHPVAALARWTRRVPSRSRRPMSSPIEPDRGTGAGTSWRSARRWCSGTLHGPAELLPISSSGHIALIPWLLGWDYCDADPELRKAFEVALHAGTAAALLITLRAEVSDAVHDMSLRIAELIILSFVPPAIVGFTLERPIERRLGTPGTIALGLVVRIGGDGLGRPDPADAHLARRRARRRPVAGDRPGLRPAPRRVAQRRHPGRGPAPRVHARGRQQALAPRRAAGHRRRDGAQDGPAGPPRAAAAQCPPDRRRRRQRRLPRRWARRG